MSPWKKVSIALVVAVMILSMVGYAIATRNRGLLAVEAEEVTRQDIVESVTANGEVKPKVYVNIGADLMGRITQTGPRLKVTSSRKAISWSRSSPFRTKPRCRARRPAWMRHSRNSRVWPPRSRASEAALESDSSGQAAYRGGFCAQRAGFRARPGNVRGRASVAGTIRAPGVDLTWSPLFRWSPRMPESRRRRLNWHRCCNSAKGHGSGSVSRKAALTRARDGLNKTRRTAPLSGIHHLPARERGRDRGGGLAESTRDDIDDHCRHVGHHG